MWNERYREPGFAYGTEPNDFLALSAERYLPHGVVAIFAPGARDGCAAVLARVVRASCRPPKHPKTGERPQKRRT